MTHALLDKGQALDLLINYHGAEAHAQMRAGAPADAIPQALAGTPGATTVKDVVLHHLAAGTTPSDSLTPYLEKMRGAANTGVSVSLNSCTVSESDAKKVEAWLKTTVDVVKTVIDMFFLADAAEELDEQPILSKNIGNAKSLIEKEIATLSKSASAWEKAKAFFKLLKKAFTFGMFQDVFHAMAANMSAWDYIKESVEAVVQIVAWLATDFLAALAEFVLRLTDVAEDLDDVFEDIEGLCSYDDVMAAINDLESPIQLHTPAAAQFQDAYYVASSLKGYHSILVHQTTDARLNGYLKQSDAIAAELAAGKITQEEASDKAKALTPWSKVQAVTFEDADGTVHDPVGAPAAFTFHDTLYLAILTGDDESVSDGDPATFTGDIYLSASADGSSWGAAYKLGSIGDAGCAPAFCALNETATGGSVNCTYMQGQTGLIYNCTASDPGGDWSVQEIVKGSAATTATTPDTCTNTDDDGNVGLTVLYRGSGSNTDIWQVQSNPDFSWQGPDVQMKGFFGTVGTPALPPATNNWAYVYYRSSDLLDPKLFRGYRYPGPREISVYVYTGVLASGSPAPCGAFLFYQDQQFALQAVGIDDCVAT